MMHLSDDELFHLAELTEDTQPYNDRELERMEHLKVCQECYEKFCAALALLAATGPSGCMVLSEQYHAAAAAVAEASVSGKILAAVKVVRKKLEDSAAVLMEQIDQIGTALTFGPPLALAARGGSAGPDSVCKVEELEDEKTFILFDPQKRELMLQVSVKKLPSPHVKAYILPDNEQKIEIPLEEKGNVLNGVLSDIPEADFKIQIEAL